MSYLYKKSLARIEMFFSKIFLKIAHFYSAIKRYYGAIKMNFR